MPEQVVERQAGVSANPSAALASFLGATSDRRATTDTTRALLTTVLGEFVRPHGGAWTQTLIELMEHLGAQPKATRQALARLDENG